MQKKNDNYGESRPIPTKKIDRNKDNPRIIFRSSELESLLISIQEYGIQVPISVYKENDRFILIDGERRWRCAIKLNLPMIPAIIQKKPDPLQNLVIMFNIHALREQWDILTIALKLPRIIELTTKEKRYEPSEAELAKITGLSQATIRRSKLIIKLPEEYKTIILMELEKPKSKQLLTEDFFIEMERSLLTVRKYLPGLVKDKVKVRDILINKYKSNIISNIVHFRNISKIARSENVGVDKRKAQTVLEKLFTDNNYSIENAFYDSVEWAYSDRTLEKNIDWLLKYISKYQEVDKSTPLINKFIKLRNEINKIVEDKE